MGPRKKNDNNIQGQLTFSIDTILSENNAPELKAPSESEQNPKLVIVPDKDELPFPFWDSSDSDKKPEAPTANNLNNSPIYSQQPLYTNAEYEFWKKQAKKVRKRAAGAYRDCDYNVEEYI